jgi:hypothetical protein
LGVEKPTVEYSPFVFILLKGHALRLPLLLSPEWRPDGSRFKSVLTFPFTRLHHIPHSLNIIFLWLSQIKSIYKMSLAEVLQEQ